MSRRSLSLLLLAVVSVLASACAEPVAPVSEDTTSTSCRGGWIGSDGRCNM